MAKDADPIVGARIRARRTSKGWTLDDLAGRAGTSPGYLSKIETGKRAGGPDVLSRIATAFGIEVEDLTIDPERRHQTPIRYDKNPKPVRLGDVLVDRVFLMIGNHTETAEIAVRYKRGWLKMPAELRSLHKELAEKAKEQAFNKPTLYFNGPNVRLLSVLQENSQQSPTGQEKKGWVLELGPVSWDEHSVLNTFLDDDLLLGSDRTIRQRFADQNMLYRNGPDLRWCQLSNILTVAMIPITTDGYGLVQHRSRTGVNVGGNTYISGVCENVHRYLDEAFHDNLAHRLRPLETSAHFAVTRPVDHFYEPEGAPSPLLAAQRGVYEELSEGLYLILKDATHRFKFLNIVLALDSFNPHLVGVIELPLTRKEVEKHIEESPGKDHSESTTVDYLPLTAENKKTFDFMHDQRRWTIVGLSALISSMWYWNRKK